FSRRPRQKFPDAGRCPTATTPAPPAGADRGTTGSTERQIPSSNGRGPRRAATREALSQKCAWFSRDGVSTRPESSPRIPQRDGRATARVPQGNAPCSCGPPWSGYPAADSGGSPSPAGLTTSGPHAHPGAQGTIAPDGPPRFDPGPNRSTDVADGRGGRASWHTHTAPRRVLRDIRETAYL